MKIIKLIVLFILAHSCIMLSHSFTHAQTLIVNEFSNGNSGSREYMELVAVGPSCTTIDIRNWIIDDNNGDFSGGPSTGEGIASGHIRFTNDIQWATVPVGSIILVYNASDKNLSILLSDDETDSNNDSVYILPCTSTLMEYCTSIPNSSNDNYSPCTYSAPANWTSIGLRNSGDVAQVRNSTGGYVHGLSYGPSPMTGGPDNLKLSNTSGTGRVGFFSNTTSNDYTVVSNFTFGNVPADETPGSPNNAANLGWIEFLRESCILEYHNDSTFTLPDEPVDAPTIVKICDILGRVYTEEQLTPGKLFIIKYSDGSTIKRIMR